MIPVYDNQPTHHVLVQPPDTGEKNVSGLMIPQNTVIRVYDLGYFLGYLFLVGILHFTHFEQLVFRQETQIAFAC